MSIMLFGDTGGDAAQYRISGRCDSAERLNHGLKDGKAVGRSQQRLARAVGVRHHAEHVAAFVEDAGDVVQRAVGVGLASDLA